MKIESFTFMKSTHQGPPIISRMDEVSSRIKIRNFKISVTGLKGFILSFKIVCTPEELYYPKHQVTSDNCFITDPADGKERVEIIEFLRSHANDCEKIREFLALLPNTPAQHNTSTVSSSAQDTFVLCSSSTCSNSTLQTQPSALERLQVLLQCKLEQNQRELDSLKPLKEEIERFALMQAALRAPVLASGQNDTSIQQTTPTAQLNTKADEVRKMQLGQQTPITATSVGLFSKSSLIDGVLEWIKQQLVPNYTSSSVMGANNKVNDTTIDMNIPVLILTDKQNIEHHFTNVRLKQKNEPLSKSNLVYEALESKDLGNENASKATIFVPK